MFIYLYFFQPQKTILWMKTHPAIEQIFFEHLMCKNLTNLSLTKNLYFNGFFSTYYAPYWLYINPFHKDVICYFWFNWFDFVILSIYFLRGFVLLFCFNLFWFIYLFFTHMYFVIFWFSFYSIVFFFLFSFFNCYF